MTIGSVWVMNMLLFDRPTAHKGEEIRIRDFLPPKAEEDLNRRNREKKVEKESQPTPPPTLSEPMQNLKQSSNFDYKIPPLDLSKTLAGMSFDSGYAARNVVPLSGIPPSYPRHAQVMKIEGFVEIEFTITKDGTVEDIVVINEENGEYFKETAIKALTKWHFKPRLVNGKAVSQRAIQTFEFRLK